MAKRKLRFKKSIIRFFILVVPLPLLVFSTYEIINYLIDSPKTKEIITEVIDNTEVMEYESDKAEIIETEEEHPDTPYWNFIKMNLIDVNFNELKRTNNDTVAWIYLGGTNVNYPVVQTNNNDYYLTHSFDKSENEAGWLFMDYRNNKDEYKENTIIYAHNRKDKTMFGSLDELLTNNWYNNEDNRVIKMSSETNNTLWQIFSVYVIETTNDYIRTYFENTIDYQEFLNLIKGRSYRNFNTSVNTNDKVLTLSTCHGKTKKLVVHAKLIKIEAK